MIDAEDWMKLTDNQKKCVSLYIRHGNKLGAFRETYDCTRRSQKTTIRACATFFASDKIRKVTEAIQTEAVKRAGMQIDELINDAAKVRVDSTVEQEKVVIDAAWVLERAALLADFNIRKFIEVDTNGSAYYNFSNATDEDWYCIQEYSSEIIDKEDRLPVTKLKLKIHDKIRALELVGKHIDVQAFRNQVGVGNPDGTPLDSMSDDELKDEIARLNDAVFPPVN